MRVVAQRVMQAPDPATRSYFNLLIEETIVQRISPRFPDPLQAFGSHQLIACRSKPKLIATATSEPIERDRVRLEGPCF